MQPSPTVQLRRRLYVGALVLAAAGLTVSPASVAAPAEVKIDAVAPAPIEDPVSVVAPVTHKHPGTIDTG